MNTVMRDLEADLAICEAASPGPWRQDSDGFLIVANGIHIADVVSTEEDARFIAEARTGWPYTIRRALAAEAELLRVNVENRNLEAEVDRLRNEINILQEQLEQRRCSA